MVFRLEPDVPPASFLREPAAVAAVGEQLRRAPAQPCQLDTRKQSLWQQKAARTGASLRRSGFHVLAERRHVGVRPARDSARVGHRQRFRVYVTNARKQSK